MPVFRPELDLLSRLPSRAAFYHGASMGGTAAIGGLFAGGASSSRRRRSEGRPFRYLAIFTVFGTSGQLARSSGLFVCCFICYILRGVVSSL